jgi:hypothetical protein
MWPMADPAAYDAAASRLYFAVQKATTIEAAFPVRLRDGLDVALSLFDSDVDLVPVLLLTERGSAEVDRLRNAWSEKFAQLLREAAAEDPKTILPPAFVEDYLIGGLCGKLTNSVAADSKIRFRDMLGELFEVLIVYYEDSARRGRRPKEVSL